MPSTLALIPYLAPLLLAGVAFLAISQPGARPTRILLTSRLATLAALGVALISALIVATNGAMTSPLIGAAGVGLAVRLDPLSATMFVLVSFVGAIVAQYSRNYLDGDTRHGAFLGGLCLTLAAVSLLVLSGNLFQLALGWIATSLALHRLLVFYADRPAAVTAARKKFITARLGDGLLIVAFILIGTTFGSADIATILETARAAAASEGGVALSIYMGVFLIALAALLKSAQFPTHGWLIEVMETPTPVSALLHAGIINAGGFLVIRFADVMLMSAGAMHILAIVGGVTALFGAVVMLTQTSVKVSLAWSTVAQMGFMLLQCGLGAFALAVLHIVAHSLYKAHAFLSSGSVVDIARASWVPSAAPPRPLAIAGGVALAVGLYAGLGWAFGVTVGEAPQVLALGTILILGVSLLVAQSAAGKPNLDVIGRTVLIGGAVTTAYFALQSGTFALFASVLPPLLQPDAVSVIIMVLLVSAFAAITILQIVAPRHTASPLWQRARVHVANGFYANAVFNKWVGAFKKPTATAN